MSLSMDHIMRSHAAEKNGNEANFWNCERRKGKTGIVTIDAELKK